VLYTSTSITAGNFTGRDCRSHQGRPTAGPG
jgi:hypothetical protein